MLKKGIIWTAGLAIALTSGLAAVGAVAKDKAPQLAVSLQPVNGYASETLASNSLKAAVAANDGRFPNSVDPAAEAAAKQAFLAEPITPEAIAVLALGTTEGKQSELMHKALALSRRQQLVLGWMIVDAGTRDDIPAILSHYDTMLRTSSSAASVVIPVVVQALKNDSFVKPLATLLRKNPHWAGSFWETAVKTPDAIVNISLLRQNLPRKIAVNNPFQDRALIYKLVEEGFTEQAEVLYSFLTPQNNQYTIVNDPDFLAQAPYPPFDWQLFSTGEYGAAIKKSHLHISAISNSGGLLARQLIRLPAGEYLLRVELEEDTPPNAQLDIDFRCAKHTTTSKAGQKIPIKKKLTEKTIWNKSPACIYFWVNLILYSGEGPDGIDLTVKKVNLVRINPSL